MPPKSLTTHLATLTPHSLNRATTHPFLQLAGQGQIPKPLLAQWLSQDRLYAQSYIRFVGLLLSKIRVPSSLPTSPTSTSKQGGGEEGRGKGGVKTLESRIASTLIDALINIRRELEFFEDTAREYGLDLNTPATSTSDQEGGEGEGQKFGPNPITHAYIDLFMSSGSAGSSLLEGLVVLWATETCYLRAWRFAGGFLGRRQGEGGTQGLEQGEEEQDLDGGALRKEFIPNWSSVEFEEFVDAIGALVDEMAAREFADGGGREKEEVLGRCERWWRQVVWLEERFWPEVSL